MNDNEENPFDQLENTTAQALRNLWLQKQLLIHGYISDHPDFTT